MPVIAYNKKDLLKLVGQEFSDETLAKIIEKLKPEVEEISEEEIIVEVTPDRPDFYGVEGLAKAIRDFAGLKSKENKLIKPSTEVKVEKVKARPYVACAIVKNVKLDDYLVKYLMNLQEILTNTIGRKRKKVAIGLHDLDKIKGKIVYRAANPDEKMIPLGHIQEMTLKKVLEKTEKGKEFAHILKNTKQYPVFVDEEGIFSFPPILNSDRTKVTENTKNIFVDVTGIDRKAVMEAINLLAFFFLQRGWKVEQVKMKFEKKSYATPEAKDQVIEVSVDYINKMLGTKLSRDEIISLLRKVGLKAFSDDDKLVVVVPYYRIDVLHPVDIVEDVAIAYDYDNFELELPKTITLGKAHELEIFSEKVRKLMIGMGFQEIMTPVLTNKEKQYKMMLAKEEECVEIANPVSQEYTCMRTWLLPNLLSFLAKNKRHAYPQKIFEIGNVVVRDDKEEVLAKNVRKLCFVISGKKGTFHEAKACLLGLLKNLGKQAVFDKSYARTFIKGRLASIFVSGKEIGFIGEINPEVLENFGLEMPVVACELNIEKLKEL